MTTSHHYTETCWKELDCWVGLPHIEPGEDSDRLQKHRNNPPCLCTKLDSVFALSITFNQTQDGCGWNTELLEDMSRRRHIHKNWSNHMRFPRSSYSYEHCELAIQVEVGFFQHRPCARLFLHKVRFYEGELECEAIPCWMIGIK